MRVFDIHTHLLPGVDDGAKDVDQSTEMLKLLKAQGVTDIVLTPHFYPHRFSIESFIKKRKLALDSMTAVFLKHGIAYHLGAEVSLADTFFHYDDIKELCFDKGKHILVEIPFENIRPDIVLGWLNKMSANYSVTPVIAHIERYPWLFKEVFLAEVNSMGCYVQFDIDSLERGSTRRKILRFIEKGLLHVAGSDCHDLVERRPNFDVLKQYVSEDAFVYLNENSQEFFM